MWFFRFNFFDMVNSSMFLCHNRESMTCVILAIRFSVLLDLFLHLYLCTKLMIYIFISIISVIKF